MKVKRVRDREIEAMVILAGCFNRSGLDFWTKARVLNYIVARFLGAEYQIVRK